MRASATSLTSAANRSIAHATEQLAIVVILVADRAGCMHAAEFIFLEQYFRKVLLEKQANF